MRAIATVVVTFHGGSNIIEAVDEAVLLAEWTKRPVSGDFNGTEVSALPGQTTQTVMDMWRAAFDAKARALEQRTADARLERIENKLDTLLSRKTYHELNEQGGSR